MENRPIAAVLAELEVVDMGRIAILKHEDQFMLGAVKTTLAGIRLYPDDQILEFTVDGFARGRHLAEVVPVHENKVD
jgi:hypothetical protein